MKSLNEMFGNAYGYTVKDAIKSLEKMIKELKKLDQNAPIQFTVLQDNMETWYGDVGSMSLEEDDDCNYIHLN